MSQCFSFRIKKEASDNHNSLIIFIGQFITSDQILLEIKKEVETNLVPRRVYIVGMSTENELIRNIIEEEFFSRDMKSFIGEAEDKILYLTVNADGIMKSVKNPELDFTNLSSEILNQGAIHIFKTRQGILESGSDYHFSKPSGDHTNKFMRVSNILTSGIEVQFLSISLLPYLENNIKRIYVDTSSIAYLISCAVQFSKKFQDKTPNIESFESYTIFNKPFDFVADRDSLVFVSATTSGSLVSKICLNNNFTKEQLITIFYTRKKDDQIGIIDINNAVNGEIYSDNDSNCKYCKIGSKIIQISGEQFLPETPNHKKLLIKKVDFSKERETFFQEFATKGLLNWDVNNNGYNEHFFINIEDYLNNKDYSKSFDDKLEKEFNKHFSRDIKTVLSLDDAASVLLMEKIKSLVEQEEQEKINWLTVTNCSDDLLKDHPSVMVIAGAITSGRKLLSASRKLRCIKDSSTIKYMIGFSKLPTHDALDQLSKDLRQGGHSIIVLKTLLLPRIKAPLETSWKLEKDFLKRFSNNNPFSEKVGELDFPISFEQRLEDLDHVKDKSNMLFLNNNGIELSLRNTFAFWSSINLTNTNASQSDVYWTIQAVLHDLRMKENNEGLGHSYHSTVLSPVCFDRYNDGVIQACFLRSALPIELNYSMNEEFSRQMTDILKSIIENHNIEQGEAGLEFLLAISIERLKVIDKHLKEILQIPREGMSIEMLFLLQYLEDSI